MDFVYEMKTYDFIRDNLPREWIEQGETRGQRVLELESQTEGEWLDQTWRIQQCWRRNSCITEEMAEM